MRRIRLPLEATRGKGLPAIWEQGGRPRNDTDSNSNITAQVVAYPSGATIKPVHWWTPRRDWNTGEVRKDAHYFARQHALFVADTGMLVVQTAVVRHLLNAQGSDAIEVRIYQIADIISKGTMEFPAWEAECNLVNAKVNGAWKQPPATCHRNAVEAAIAKTRCVCTGPHFANLLLESKCATARLEELVERERHVEQRSSNLIRMDEVVGEKTRRHLEITVGQFNDEAAYKFA